MLHRLRVKGYAEAPEGTDQEVRALAAEGLIIRRDGRVVGWRLTPAGLEEHGRLVAGELATTGARGHVTDAHRRFQALNLEFLGLCTAAQVDGDDVRARLDRVHEQVVPVVDDLAAVLARFGPYRERFEAAVRHVRDGDNDFLTRPLVDSYHTIWSELHEDLLATLGIARGSETEWLASAK